MNHSPTETKNEIDADIRKKATDLMDNACLGEQWVGNGVYAALRDNIARAIQAERDAAKPLLDALSDSIDSHRECASYKGDFLRAKHGDEEEADAHSAVLALYRARFSPPHPIATGEET